MNIGVMLLVQSCHWFISHCRSFLWISFGVCRKVCAWPNLRSCTCTKPQFNKCWAWPK